MKYSWQALEKPKVVFTVRNATMRDLKTGKVIQFYASNTRINVVQKLVTDKGTFYRTESAVNNGLNWAFEASAFGLPNEVALSVPTHSTPPTVRKSSTPKTPRTKQKDIQKAEAPKDREEPKPPVIPAKKPSFLKKIFFWK